MTISSTPHLNQTYTSYSWSLSSELDLRHGWNYFAQLRKAVHSLFTASSSLGCIVVVFMAPFPFCFSASWCWLSTSFCVSVVCLSAFFFLSLYRCLWSFSLSHCLLLKLLQHKVTLMSPGTGADSLGLRSPPVSVCQSPYLSNTLRRVPGTLQAS